MPVRSFILSFVLHLLVLGLMLFQFKFGEEQTPKKITPALMIVDLTKVKLANQTNLPQKVKKEKKSPKAVTKETPKPKEKSKASSKKEKPKETPKKENKTPVVKTPPPKPKEMPKPIPQKPVKEAVAVKPKSDKTQKTTKTQDKTEKIAPKPSAKSKQTTQENTMDSLLKSVRKIQKPLDEIPQTVDEELPPITDGIKGGTGGSLSRILTISEQDLIANQLRKCWNVNAGVAGIDDMIIEISATVGRDGRIRTVKINNMKSDPAFRTTAESAQRAVWICDKREDSPFKILSEKYGSQYDSWKELFLRFNPMDNSIF